MFFDLKIQLDTILKTSLENDVFSACSVGFATVIGTQVNSGYVYIGENSKQGPSTIVDESSLFDLASLTKPLVTSLCIQVLLDAKVIDIEDRLSKFFINIQQDKKDISILNLLNHTAGFPSHKPYYTDLISADRGRRFDKLIEMILEQDLVYTPGRFSVYSDLGYILLGSIIEKISEQRLDDFWREKVLHPLKLEKGLFFAGQEEIDIKRFVGTGNCVWSEKRLLGVVHDDNCRAVGGVAGHAGVFGTTPAVLSLGENLLMLYEGRSKHPFISCDSFRSNMDNKVMDRRFGFDTPNGKVSSSGRYFSELSVGHLGYTGTSLWLDFKQGVAITLLTNRVICGEGLDKIRKLRPLVHDTIMEYLLKK